MDGLPNWLASALASCLAAATVLALRPLVRARRPTTQGNGYRSVDARRAPPLGGISVLFAVAVASLAFLPLEGAYRGILIGATAIAILGIVADIRGVQPLAMFAGQVGAAAVAVAYGVSIERFTFPLVGVVAELPTWADVPLTIAWIVLLVRLVDFVDGLDGVAAAVCGGASIVFVVLSLGLGTRGTAILSAIIAGACAGFLVRNFYPARILLGHAGSLTLGYLVATVAVEGLLKTAAFVGVLLPFAALAIPALDSSRAIASRLVGAGDDGSGVANGTRAKVVAVLVGWCLVVGATVLASSTIGFRAHGEWHVWRTALVAGMAMLVVVASIYVIGVLERARPSRRARAAARRSVHAPLLPAMVAIGSSSPSGAIETARTSVYPTARRGTDTIIRVLDVVLSGVLLLLLSPLLALIGAVVVVTSGRPVFHSGERVGLHGDVFRMWKFRTLRPDAELRLGPFYGAELDRRLPAEITRVGRVLRATHLDEMPQLLSVVVGDMSIVGPRPLRPRFFEELCDEIPRYWQRLTVRPGVTGLAQTRIDRGASWEEKLAHDLEWIADRSVYLYVRTILATVWRVVVAVVTLRWRSIDGEDD